MLQSDCCGNTRKQFQHNKSKTKWNTLKLLPKTMETVSKNKIKRWDNKAQQKKHCGNKAQQICFLNMFKKQICCRKHFLFLICFSQQLQLYSATTATVSKCFKKHGENSLETPWKLFYSCCTQQCDCSIIVFVGFVCEVNSLQKGYRISKAQYFYYYFL